MLIKSITCKVNIDIVTTSRRDRNNTAVVMQINFTELKFEINASQRINASQILVASFRSWCVNPKEEASVILIGAVTSSHFSLECIEFSLNGYN